MKQSEKIFLWCLRIAGILALGLLVYFFSENKSVPSFVDGGDLYRLTSVQKFREEIKPFYRKGEKVKGYPKDSAVVWWIGDSFSKVQFGHKPFPEKFSEKYGTSVAFFEFLDFPGRGSEILNTIKNTSKEKRPKAIVVECVERNIPTLSVFLTLSDYKKQNSWTKKFSKIRDKYFIAATPTVDFMFRRTSPVPFIRNHLDSYRYKIYGDHHPLAVPHHKDSEYYFEYAEDSFEKYEGSDISEIQENFLTFSNASKELGVKVIFVFPPNRNYFFQSKSRKDVYIENLFYAMDKDNLIYVDLHTPLYKARDAGEKLYWNTDTHWNEKAVEISVNALYETFLKISNSQ